MTIEELCECSPDELDKLSFTQIEDYFKPFWPTTRPERKAASAVVITERQKVGATPSSKPRTKGKTAQEVSLESKFSPERLAWLKENGIL